MFIRILRLEIAKKQWKFKNNKNIKPLKNFKYSYIKKCVFEFVLYIRH